MIKLPNVLPAPKKTPIGLPNTVKWLAGEGAGSWFLIEETVSKNNYKVIRFSPKGAIECEGLFTTKQLFELNEEYSITYPSHCAKVTLSQFDKIITLQKQQQYNTEKF